MKEQDPAELLEKVKTTLRNCQIDLAEITKSKFFDDCKETYQNRLIEVMSQLTTILHKL